MSWGAHAIMQRQYFVTMPHERTPHHQRTRTSGNAATTCSASSNSGPKTLSPAASAPVVGAPPVLLSVRAGVCGACAWRAGDGEDDDVAVGRALTEDRDVRRLATATGVAGSTFKNAGTHRR